MNLSSFWEHIRKNNLRESHVIVIDREDWLRLLDEFPANVQRLDSPYQSRTTVVRIGGHVLVPHDHVADLHLERIFAREAVAV